eukprot:CAMPEP_0194563982 /NCGR_PEP_ID=MMETSP0292-20121207/3820_1 /TAXON_ID=39354 /ORGANISM="Heterosigma akashiwo, Strain CCMP2393" /LENGTH=229 /DNA_ID=CAMNT_0039413021 /DNA_START=131 /DNA_END=821 /DNA_ORIENTATION=-
MYISAIISPGILHTPAAGPHSGTQNSYALLLSLPLRPTQSRCRSKGSRRAYHATAAGAQLLLLQPVCAAAGNDRPAPPPPVLGPVLGAVLGPVLGAAPPPPSSAELEAGVGPDRVEQLLAQGHRAAGVARKLEQVHAGAAGGQPRVALARGHLLNGKSWVKMLEAKKWLPRAAGYELQKCCLLFSSKRINDLPEGLDVRLRAVVAARVVHVPPQVRRVEPPRLAADHRL